jgi:membrane protein YqaA with SNARE-associated domain
MRKRALASLHMYTLGWLRQVYDWVLSWAKTKYATVALAITAFTESSFFPIPPDVLLVVMSVAKPKRSFRYAGIATLFSVAGGLFGYFLGAVLWNGAGELIISGLGLSNYFDLVGEYFKDNAFTAIAGAAFTPVPFKVFTLSAGFWRIDLLTFTIACIIGRGLRFFLESSLLYFFGKPMAIFIDKYFNYLTLGAFALVTLVVFFVQAWL